MRTDTLLPGAVVTVVSRAIAVHATVGEVTLAEWNDIVAVNLASAFCTTKAGLIGLTELLALELAPKITVNAISPGCTRTDMTRNALAEDEEKIASRVPVHRIAEPGEIAALAGEEAGYSTGETINANGGIYLQ
jgi:NAD(P)-dependent dehydrogenase (short-subunit alcohol dehydrogenase family)